MWTGQGSGEMQGGVDRGEEKEEKAFCRGSLLSPGILGTWHRKDSCPQGVEEWSEANLLLFTRFYGKKKDPRTCPRPKLLALEVNSQESSRLSCSYAKWTRAPRPLWWASKRVGSVGH